MLECHSHGGPGLASGTTAHGVDHHQHGPCVRAKRIVNIVRGTGFPDTELGQILPHNRDQVFGVSQNVTSPQV